MDFGYFPLERFVISRSNMRYARKAPDIADILPSVRKRGVIVPVIARGCADEGLLEIEAGRRRYFAAKVLVDEGQGNVMLPCVIAAPGDDADALEVSMIENLLRQDPDQVTQWASFVRLVKNGRDVEDIAATFGLSALAVKRILALGNLLPRIREAFRAEEIDAGTIRHLTLASKAQQKAWLALCDDPEAHAPRGSQLKAWLFGGASIAVSAALFDLATYQGQIVTNLFEEEGCFAEAEQFWAAQHAEIEARKVAYLANGWSDVVIVPPEQHFATWEYEHRPKRKGGRVYVDLRGNGEVTFHEGYLTRKEARRIDGKLDGSAGDLTEQCAPARAEVTAAMGTYVDLHRHAAVRCALAADPGTALRVMLAHAICGSPLWRVEVQSQWTSNDAITQSIEVSLAVTRFDERRRTVLALLGFDPERSTVILGREPSGGVSALLLHLLTLTDGEVMRAIAVVMAESLASGTGMIETLGVHMCVDMADYWQADAAFLGLIRDREVLSTILAEISSEAMAKAHEQEKGKTIKALITDCLTGSNGREKRDHWVPRWMAFPPSAYTSRGGVPSVAAAERVRWMAETDLSPDMHDPDTGDETSDAVSQQDQAAVDDTDDADADDADPSMADDEAMAA